MCKECGRHICPPACPGFEHILAGKGRAETFCSLCGSAIYRGEGYYRSGDIAVCNECEAVMTLDELGRLFDTKEALLLCGFERLY